LKRRCPICKERGIAPWRGFGKPVHCDSCGCYFKLARSGVYLVGTLAWVLLGNEFGLLLALVAAINTIAQPLSWWSIGILGAVALFLGIPAITPLREVEAPGSPEAGHNRWNLVLQLLLIALPFLQWMLPLIGRTHDHPYMPVASMLATVAAGVIVYSAVLNGRYLFYRGLQRRLARTGRAPILTAADFALTLVIPCMLAGISLGIFYLQARRFDADLRELGLLSLAALIILILSLLACYWAGTRRQRGVPLKDLGDRGAR